MSRRKRVFLVLAVVCLAGAAGCLSGLIRIYRVSATTVESIGGENLQTAADTQPEPETDPGTAEESTAEAEEPYVSPIDFEALWERNPDVAGWLEFEGLSLSQPVMFRPDDNSYYLRRNSDGEDDSNGSLFIEDYNAGDFSDPVIVIYGHNMSSGAMFGEMQELYSDRTYFEEHGTFTLYCPEAEYVCSVIAAVPYSSAHILYYHDFTSYEVRETFLGELCSSRSLLANVADDAALGEEDKLVILSTCRDSDRSDRYLVVGRWSPES